VKKNNPMKKRNGLQVKTGLLKSLILVVSPKPFFRALELVLEQLFFKLVAGAKKHVTVWVGRDRTS
jgi:hypothetical protein